MRTRSLVSGAALAATLAITTSGVTAVAAPSTTYDGEFGGTIVYRGCTTPAPKATTTGTWAVTLHGASAKATFDIYVGGEPHVAYTFPNMKRLPVQAPTTFSVYGATQAGLLTVTLSGSKLTYTIAPYNFGGLTCDSVTYPGSS